MFYLLPFFLNNSVFFLLTSCRMSSFSVCSFFTFWLTFFCSVAVIMPLFHLFLPCSVYFWFHSFFSSFYSDIFILCLIFPSFLTSIFFIRHFRFHSFFFYAFISAILSFLPSFYASHVLLSFLLSFLPSVFLLSFPHSDSHFYFIRSLILSLLLSFFRYFHVHTFIHFIHLFLHFFMSSLHSMLFRDDPSSEILNLSIELCTTEISSCHPGNIKWNRNLLFTPSSSASVAHGNHFFRLYQRDKSDSNRPLFVSNRNILKLSSMRLLGWSLNEWDTV